MLVIPESVKNLFKADGVRKNFRASFPKGELPDITNENIVQESVKFTESLCSQDVLKFGLTEASVIEFETVGVANMYGMQIKCSCEIDVSSLSEAQMAEIEAGIYDGELVRLAESDLGYAFFRVPYGIFRVESCPRNHEAMAKRKVTAYSENYGKKFSAAAFFPEPSFLDKILVDPAAVYATRAGALGLGTDVTPVADTWVQRPQFFGADGTGRTFYIRVMESFIPDLPPNAAPQNRYVSPKYYVANVSGCDFVQADYPSAPLPIFEHLMEYYSASYIDLTCDAEGNKIYASNEEALIAQAPWLYRPSIVYMANIGDVYTGNAMNSVLMPGVMCPVINNAEALDSSAFSQAPFEETDEETTASSIIPYLVYGPIIEPSDENSTIVQVEIYEGYNRVYPIPLSKLEPLPEVSIKQFSLADRSDYRAVLKASGDLPDLLLRQYNFNSTEMVSVSQHSYENAVDLAAFLDGHLELNAQFGKVNRYGQLEAVRLSDLNPVELTPPEYSQLWWDEFNVEPIGKIAFSFTDEEGSTQDVAYSIGSGASTYDMSSNAVLKDMYEASVSKIQSLLAERFVPNLGPISFTPIDLDMKGLPYMEDGDYLQITAEDGTVAKSYNMRHELQGVQALQAEITSVSGEIIDSEEGS